MAKRAQNQTKALTKAQLFGGPKASRLESIDVPELGGVIYLAQLKASEILPFISVGDDDSMEKMNARQNQMLVKALVDEKGTRIFGDEDADKMNDLPWDVYTRIVRHLTGKIQGTKKETEAPLTDGESSPFS